MKAVASAFSSPLGPALLGAGDFNDARYGALGVK